MNVKQSFLSLLLLVGISPGLATGANIVYTLSDPGLSNGFGFSGTVTTDGSLGYFSTAAPILSWDITLSTPSGVDGVGLQTLTPGNSTVVTSFIPVGAGIQLTSTTFYLVPSATLPTSADLVFDVNPTPAEGFERLSYTIGGGGGGLGSQVISSDQGETPASSSVQGIHDATGVLIGTAIPEPSALILTLFAGLVFTLQRERKLFQIKQ